MKQALSSLFFVSFILTKILYAQTTVNFAIGPSLNFNRINTVQLDSFALSWNDYYKVNMKKDYANWNKSFSTKGIEASIEYYDISKTSFHMTGSMGINWGSQSNESILWNNYKHRVELHCVDVPVFGGLGIKLGKALFLDYSMGANFRNAALISTVTYPDGSTSMGYEMDILGHYESSIPKFFYGFDASLRLSRLLLSARASFPLKNNLVADNVMVDYDVNRYRQTEFPVNFNTFVTEVSAVNEANMLKATNLHGAIISLSAKIILGKIK